ncbi:MAG: isoprenyl synthetase [Bacteroidetes bacterium 4572_117]|nr:MAG: isoprenyl synthetase [Bacteroidetes bacterium 4572_117]
MYTFKKLQQIVDKHLNNLELNNEPSELYEPIKYILEIGGKRIRPSLVLAAYNLFNDEVENAIQPALALEVFHNFTLLHDDIMDKADLRRNQQTVHKKWGENVAILSGDAMSIKAYELLGNIPEEFLPEVLKAFNITALQVCEGQQLDMNFEGRMDVSVNEYIEMIRLKTSVLIAVCLKIGAIMANATKTDAQKLYDFGLNLGLAFQLQDDYLDAYGDVHVFGKKIGGDIVANKKTFLLTKAFETADEKTTNELKNLISDTDIGEEQKIKDVLAIYNQLNVDKLLKECMESYYDKAIQALESTSVEHDKNYILKEFAGKLMNRES